MSIWNEIVEIYQLIEGWAIDSGLLAGLAEYEFLVWMLLIYLTYSFFSSLFQGIFTDVQEGTKTLSPQRFDELLEQRSNSTD